MANHKRKEIARRLARIRGHVQAINEMVEKGRPYPEVVHQIAAVRSALDSAIKVIVDDLVEECVQEADRKESLAVSLLELQQVVGNER